MVIHVTNFVLNPPRTSMEHTSTDADNGRSRFTVLSESAGMYDFTDGPADIELYISAFTQWRAQR